MAILEIPLRSDIPAYQYQITLDGIVYTMHFHYNGRSDRWIWDINDVDDNPILNGIPLLIDFPLIVRYPYQELPPGNFILIDQSGSGDSPGEKGLGDNYKLLYEEAES